MYVLDAATVGTVPLAHAAEPVLTDEDTQVPVALAEPRDLAADSLGHHLRQASVKRLLSKYEP